MPSRQPAGGASARLAARAAVLLLFAAGSSRADVGTPLVDGLLRRSWSSEHGLPQDSVQALAQTRDGYLWVGTQQGLARFDGVRFSEPERSAPGVPREHVLAVQPARDGGLWVGLRRGGLARFERGLLVAVHPSAASVRAVLEAADGRLWIGTEDGLECVQGPGCPVRRLAGHAVFALHEDQTGLWVGADDGLYVLDGPQAPAAELRAWAGPVRSIVGRRAGGLWVGTDGQGLLRVAPGTVERLGPRGGHVRAVLEDRGGTVWLASDEGLERLGPAGPERVEAVSGRLNALLEDREGSLWVGTRYEGLARLTRPRLAVYGQRQDGKLPPVLSVYEDRGGRVWFGTAGAGLGRLQGRSASFLSRASGLADDIVGPVLEGRDGTLWFGTRGAPLLYRFKGGRLRSLSLERSAASLYEDGEGTLWIGTIGAGLYRGRGDALERVPADPGCESVRAIVPDEHGGLWLATAEGLARFRREGRRVELSVASLRGTSVTALLQEPGGPLWLATPAGLGRLVDGHLTRYGLREGLCDDAIHAILDDGRGQLWLGSNHGILRLAKAQLDELARGTRESVACTAYGRGDGMESQECHGGYQPSAFKGSDGRLWFATLKGVVAVDPARLPPENPLPPPVSIERVRVDGRGLDPERPGRVPGGTRRLEIDYTALSLVAPEKVRFRHRLLGWERDWVEAGAQRSVSYTNLPPGDYQFEVRACNNDGVWNAEGASLGLRVEPLLHQMTGFWALLGLLGCALALGLHHARARGLRLRNALLSERARLSQEVHDSVSQIMTGVILQLDGAQATLEGEGACRPYVERAAQLARQGIEEMRRMLRGLPSTALERSDLARALRRRTLPLVEGMPVRLRVREEGRARSLPAGLAHELFQIGQEALTNALRHGRPREIEVLVSYTEDGVRLSVRDDGRGFEPAAREGFEGLGLAGIRRRVSDHRGSVDVRSGAGAGTTVAVFLPCGR